VQEDMQKNSRSYSVQRSNFLLPQKANHETLPLPSHVTAWEMPTSPLRLGKFMKRDLTTLEQ